MYPLARIALALSAGAYLGTATFVPWLWIASPAAFAVVLYLVFASTRAQSFVSGWAAGCGIMGASLAWGFTALPLNWLGIPDPVLGLMIVILIWAAYSIVLGLPIALWALAFRHHPVGMLLLVTVSLSWVCIEILRALAFSVVTWGYGSAFSPEITFGHVGYALSWSDTYVKMAALGGVHMLGAFLAFVGTMLFLIVTNTPRLSMKAGGALGSIMVFALVGVVAEDPMTMVEEPEVVTIDGLRIAPVTMSIEPTLLRDSPELAQKAEYVATRILDTIELDPDVIVLPEYARYLRSEPLLDPGIVSRIREGLRERSILLIDSERTPESEGNYGAISFFDAAEERVVARHHKRLLIPLGEYLPAALIYAFRVVGLGAEADAIMETRRYTRSQLPFSTRRFERDGVSMGILACSETFAPYGYRSVANAGAHVLINIASHSWVRGSAPILFNQTLAMARVHVAYTGLPYIQATNYAPSYVIYPAGYVTTP